MSGIVKLSNPGRSYGIVKTMNSAIRSQLSHSIPLNNGRRAKPIVSADYIVGLTDGEVCFYVNIRTSKKYRAGAKVELHFHIKMQERDKNVLEKIKNTLKCGNVYFQKEKRINHAQCYRYTVAAHQNILKKIIPFFKTYNLQSDSKRMNFNLFCSIASIVENGQHLTKKGINKIRALKQQMNQRAIGLA